MRVDGLEQAARLSRRRHLQLGPQAPREVVERHARGGDLPRGDQAPDELAMGALAKRVELDAATRDADRVVERAGRLGVRGQALEHVAEAAAVRLAGGVDPLGVEPRQQLPVAQIDGRVQPPLPDEPLELPGVHETPSPTSPTRSRVATSAPSPAEPSARRTATSSVRRLLRALESSTSGQNRPATSERGCMPSWRASQPSSEHARRRSGIGNATPSDSSAKAPKRRTRSMATRLSRPRRPPSAFAFVWRSLWRSGVSVASQATTGGMT